MACSIAVGFFLLVGATNVQSLPFHVRKAPRTVPSFAALQKNTALVQTYTTGMQKTTTGVQKNTTGVHKNTSGVHKNTTGVRKSTSGAHTNTTGVHKNTTLKRNQTTSTQKPPTNKSSSTKNKSSGAQPRGYELVHAASVRPTSSRTLAAPTLPADATPRPESKYLPYRLNTTFFRVIYYDVRSKAGIDDRLSMLHRMLAFAQAAHAVLAFPGPQELLGSRHGNTSHVSPWWDEYYITSPRIFSFDEARCMPNVTQSVVTSPDLANDLPGPVYNRLLREDRPLCLIIQVKAPAIVLRPPLDARFERALGVVSVWTSPRIRYVTEQVLAEASFLRHGYNALHVRLGDKATPRCSNASFVNHRLHSLMDQLRGSTFYKYASREQLDKALQEPWLVMSDGSDSFLESLKEEAAAANISVVTERDIDALASIPDNYLRYTILECLFGAADVVLTTFKDIGFHCLARPQHIIPTRFLGCNEPNFSKEHKLAQLHQPLRLGLSRQGTFLNALRTSPTTVV